MAGVLPHPGPPDLARVAPQQKAPTQETTQKCPLPEGNGHFTQFEVSLLLIAALVARFTKQLAVLLLGHTLATLLNN
jgi:hypothetical protein